MSIRFRKIRCEILVLLTLISTFLPMSFCYLDSFYYFIPFARMLRVVLLIYLCMTIVGKKKVQARVLYLFIFSGFFLITTIFNGGTLKNYLDNFSSILLIGLIIDKCNMYDEERKQSVVNTCFAFFFIMLLINAILMIMFPEGVYRVVYDEGAYYRFSYPMHFLQTDNRLIEFILPAAMFTVMEFNSASVKKKYIVASIVLIVFSTIKSRALTTYLGMGVFLVILFFIYKNGIKIKTMKVITIILFGLQIVVEIIMTQPLILGAIAYLFGRIDTVLSRYSLGVKALEMFKTQPLIGFGTASVGRYFSEGAVTYWVHNLSWDLLIQGGIIGFLLFLNYILPKTRHIKNLEITSLQHTSIFAAVVSLLIMGNAESFLYSVEFYLVFALFDVNSWINGMSINQE